MKIGNIMVNAAYLGSKVLTAIAVGATKVWEGVSKYIKFKDPVVESLCMKWSSDGVGLTPDDAAKVTDIGTTFKGNTEITSFDELKEFTSVKKLGGSAFDGCSTLEGVGLDNVEEFGARVFKSSAKLKTIYAPMLKIANEPYVFYQSGVVEVTSLGVLTKIPFQMFYNCSNLLKLNIPITVTVIEAGAFHFCKKLIEINNNLSEVLEIGDEAFRSCESLEIEDLSAPNLKQLGSGAMNGVKLRRVSDLGSVSVLGNRTFQYCGILEFVELPYEITSIDDYCYYLCSSLKTVVMNATTPPTLGTGVFMYTPSDMSIYVPHDSVEAYKSATNWSAYADRIKSIKEYVEPTNNE